MPIPLSSQFALAAQLPLDNRIVAVDNTARDAIATVKRFEGLFVYITSTEKTWQLQGGITNSDWVEIGSGNVTAASNFTDLRIISSDGTGKGVKSSTSYIDDAGNIGVIFTDATNGKIYFSPNTTPTTAGGVTLHYKTTNALEIDTHLYVPGEVHFGTASNQDMYLGTASSGGPYSFLGAYSNTGTNVSVRMLNNYVFEVNRNLTTWSLAVGSSYVGSSTVTAPSNGILSQGHVIEQASYQYIGSDFSATTNTTLANVVGGGNDKLSLNLTAGMRYTFKATLFVDPDAVGGAKYAIGGTATATSIVYNINSINNATSAYVITSRQTALGGSAGNVGPTAAYTEINGTILVNTAGTLTVQFAQNVSSGTSKVLTNSTFVVKEMAVF